MPLCSSWTKCTVISTSRLAYFLPAYRPEVTILNTTRVSTLLVCTVSHVLIPPGNLTQIVAANNLTSLAEVVKTVNVPDFYGNGTNATIVEALEANRTKGYTLFAPNNEALESAGPALTALTANGTALLALLGNHVRINAS